MPIYKTYESAVEDWPYETIVEIKYNHCALAWWQLYKLYLPVISKIFGSDWTYSCCEVVKWFDPQTNVPEEVCMQKDIDMILRHMDLDELE